MAVRVIFQYPLESPSWRLTHFDRRTALNRPHRWQPTYCNGKQDSDSEHAAAVQLCLRSDEWSCATQQSELAAIRTSIRPPQGDELANGTCRPLLSPVNFSQSKRGEKFFAVWYAGPLSIRNDRACSSSFRATCCGSRRRLEVLIQRRPIRRFPKPSGTCSSRSTVSSAGDQRQGRSD